MSDLRVPQVPLVLLLRSLDPRAPQALLARQVRQDRLVPHPPSLVRREQLVQLGRLVRQETLDHKA